MERISEDETKTAFKEVFREFGLPNGIRSDNGVPFSSRSVFGLSMLSVWWLRLGIKLERIVPGHPQQNGCHERMHRTLKQSTTKPAAQNILAQQEKFDDFITEFNGERPHEALGMKTPAEVYTKSQRPYPETLPELEYSNHDRTVKVSACGSINLGKRKRVFMGLPLRGERLGVTQIDAELWRVNFMDYELGFFDSESWKFSPTVENPFTLS
jgi:putative transposase